MSLLNKIIISALIILALLSIYFGSYLPFVKAKSYIDASRSLPNVKSVQEFMEIFDKPLNFYSPVGQEEIVKFLSNTTFDILANGKQSEEVARVLVNYVEPYLLQNNIRHLLAGGNFYFALWIYGQKEDDFKKAEEYYQKTLAIGPTVPLPLYRLLDLYRSAGNQEKIKEIGEIILQYWPQDENVQKIIEAFNN